MNLENKKIAIVHDYLTQKGGAERVVIAMMKTFPRADLYTSVYDPQRTFPFFKGLRIHTTFLHKIYLPSLGHRIYLPLYPLAFKRIDLSEYEIIISSSSAFAKCVKKKNAIHIAYIYTPPRFLWMKEIYLRKETLRIPKKFYLHLFINYLKRQDLLSTKSVDAILTISRTIQEKIKKIYGRDSELLYPPVETENFKLSEKVEDFFLIVSRLVPHKRVDIAIEAFKKMGKKLVIVGTGPGYRELKKNSTKNIIFAGAVEDEELRELYSTCLALIFPQEEDFGIAPLECMASGRPVIAYGKGGVLETVIPPGGGSHPTGIFFYEQTPEGIIEAVREFEKFSFDPYRIRTHALKFDISNFKKKLIETVERLWHLHNMK